MVRADRERDGVVGEVGESPVERLGRHVVRHRDVRVVVEIEVAAHRPRAQRHLERLAVRDALGHLDEDDVGQRTEGPRAAQHDVEGGVRGGHVGAVAPEGGIRLRVDLGRRKQRDVRGDLPGLGIAEVGPAVLEIVTVRGRDRDRDTDRRGARNTHAPDRTELDRLSRFRAGPFA